MAGRNFEATIDTRPNQLWKTAAGAVLACLIAMSLVDGPVSEWVLRVGLAGVVKGSWWAQILKLPGEYYVALLIGVILLAGHRLGFWSGWCVILSGSTGLANALLKWIVGRKRPFKGDSPFDLSPFWDGWPGLFHQQNLSFASGHACISFATATALAIWFPRRRAWFYAAATIVAIERVAENAHFVSESILGAAIGYMGVQLINEALLRRFPLVVPDEAQGFPTRLEELPNDMPDTPYLSLVIPAYNEQESVPTLLSRVEAALQPIGRAFEVIIIDDGSIDQTPRLLAEAMAQKPWLRVVRMKKNAGQSAAFEAGFAVARGELIATIDADLQNDPEEIPRLVKMLEEQKVDLITGWRKDRQDTPFRRWQSRQANRIRNWISQETVNDSASSLKLYRAAAIKGLKLFNGAHRFFPTLVKMRGFTCQETPVKHSQRFAGTAKYGFRNRALRAFIDLLGIRWMKSRYLRYEATEIDRSMPGGQPTASEPALSKP